MKKIERMLRKFLTALILSRRKRSIHTVAIRLRILKNERQPAPSIQLIKSLLFSFVLVYAAIWATLTKICARQRRQSPVTRQPSGCVFILLLLSDSRLHYLNRSLPHIKSIAAQRISMAATHPVISCIFPPPSLSPNLFYHLFYPTR